MKDKWMAIFRAGDYGSKGQYTSEDLDKTVSLFNNEDKEVPITVDHIQDGPAYGWITELKRRGDVLMAKSGKVLSEFAEVVGKGLYRKRSIEIDRDTKRLKAVTFLGAKKPEIIPDFLPDFIAVPVYQISRPLLFYHSHLYILLNFISKRAKPHIIKAICSVPYFDLIFCIL